MQGGWFDDHRTHHPRSKNPPRIRYPPGIGRGIGPIGITPGVEGVGLGLEEQ